GRRGGGRPRGDADIRRARRRPLLPPRRPAPCRGVYSSRERSQPPGGGKARLPRRRAAPALSAYRRRLARPPRLRADGRGSSGGTAAPLASGEGSAHHLNKTLVRLSSGSQKILV